MNLAGKALSPSTLEACGGFLGYIGLRHCQMKTFTEEQNYSNKVLTFCRTSLFHSTQKSLGKKRNEMIELKRTNRAQILQFFRINSIPITFYYN
ncbi:hypothetical protein BpHYR1_027001 [Brachionus plicatilis]|uniref:Uncharacterized protein n=1 Tax=Brachionus plicatilis TaxID=10195 RepID=A0A3M7SPW7_BRAPC|nr:hypothetical protein BpHYR1_027001 [Brachionus plicatilis]